MNDQLDPELQDRFAALDGVEPADTWPSILASAGGAARTWRRRLVVAAALVAVVAGLGALALVEQPERDRVVSTPSTAVVAPTTTVPPTPDDLFTPPRVRDGDQVVHPVTFLDGSEISVTLPADLGFDPTGFEAEATLEGLDDPKLPPIRIDVSFCPSCAGPDTLQFDGWAVVGSGERFDAAVWSAYADLLVGEISDDGYLVLSGPSIRLGPIDGPDGVLTDDEFGHAALYLRDCAGGPSRHSAGGLSVEADPVPSEQAVTRLCAAREGIELWITGPEPTDDLVDAVDLTVRRIGPRIQASTEYLFAEPADLVFPVCWELPETGPPAGDAAAEADALLARLETDGIRDLEFLAGFSGAGNVWGRVTVSLSRRYGPSIDWLAERAGPDALCYQFLPEPGPPDELAEAATWRVAPSSLPVEEHWQDLTLLVPGGEDECGPLDPSRVLEPEVDDRTDAIAISVAVAVWDRDPQITPYVCPPPTEVRVRLTEPPDGRPLVAGD